MTENDRDDAAPDDFRGSAPGPDICPECKSRPPKHMVFCRSRDDGEERANRARR
ncbi:hypothetical protein [Catellatospora citrea]|uniref:Uncharacterized protein n=1 Tax=Catellatospora citrea TaxID=53366 RepID=A0A8J3KA96_9ACTN|nr:hypothetical protein [Catellatospora citrea]RKE05649.1 hypothetical protein C8E86_0454 [Catellatospora citrea]GIF97004.1 hypothetical protein Cci01nite_20980 [Catellatospora citrea]